MPINPVMPDSAAIEATEYDQGIATPETPAPEQQALPGVEAPPQEPEPEPEPEPDKPEPPEDDKASEAGRELAARKKTLEGRKTVIQDQINALVRERGDITRETERGRQEREALRQEIEALKAEKGKLAPAQARPAAPDNPDDPKPQEAAYDNYADYTEAISRWGARQEFRQAEAARARYQWEMRRQQSYSERYQAFAKANPTFEKEIDRDDLILTAPMVDVVKDSTVGPQILLHLSRNSDEVDRIGRLPAVIAYGEMKKLEARLEGAHSGPPQPAVSQHSKAPAPIKPVANATSRQSDTNDIPDESVSDDEHFERMNRRDEALRKRGMNPRRGYGARI